MGCVIPTHLHITIIKLTLNPHTMNLHQLWLITRYSFTEIWRNKTFRVAFMVLIPLLIAYQVSFQSDMFNIPVEYTLVLSSFIPTQNAYMFNLLLVFPLATMGFWVHKQKKYNTLEALLVHPQGNDTYSTGFILGIIIAFMIMGSISLALAGLINLFASPTSFRPLIYLFYLVTLILPTIVFIVGITSFLAARCFKNGTVTTFFMLVYLSVDILFLSTLYHGLFDPLGILLPYTFSDFTGIADLPGFLLHRTTFLLLGIGFITLAISGLPRIPNKINGRQRAACSGILALFVGLLAGFITYNHHEQVERRHALYESVYEKHDSPNKINIIAHDIRFTYQQKEARVESRVSLYNPTGITLSEIILYLNPSLEVTSIQENLSPVPFTREAQAIVISRPVSPGDSLALDIQYQGTIDEGICYLYIPKQQKEFDIDNRHYLSCRFGHRYAFLEKDYTLLTPECLWYPITSPPVNPAHPYNTPCDFTRYTLTINHPTRLTAISQGSRHGIASGTRFENEHPQRNISLCIGKYEKREITVDSVTYELYMSKNNFEILTSIDQQLTSLSDKIRDVKETIEYEKKSSYLFNRLRLVETPVTFTSHYHPATGGSEMIQPEMVLCPERGIGILNGRIRAFAQKRLRFEISNWIEPFERSLYWELNNEHILTSWEEGPLSHLKLGTTWHYESTYNIYNFNPLFFNYINYIYSHKYPTINNLLNQIVKRPWENRDPNVAPPDSQQKALDYLNGKSYQAALSDKTLSFEIINQINELKANDLLSQIILKGTSATDFHLFVQDFMKNNRFRQVNFQTFDHAFSENFGWYLSEIFPKYFDRQELPAFQVKNFRIKRILSPTEEEEDPWTPHTKFRIEFDVLNQSDVDGVITMHLGTAIYKAGPDRRVDRMLYTPRTFSVKAREAKKIIFICPHPVVSHSIYTGLSKNRPNIFDIHDKTITLEKGMESTRDSIAGEESISPAIFFPPANEIIVDNEDDNFQITNPPAPWLKRFLGLNHNHHTHSSTAVSHWEYTLMPDCFGEYCLSCLRKRTGKGESSLTWTTPINKKGKYKIYAYIPNISYSHERSRHMITQEPIRDIQYCYSISYNNREKKIKVHVPETSRWVVIGEFFLPEGECSVKLYDIGLPGQWVVGDAIKWVYQKP